MYIFNRKFKFIKIIRKKLLPFLSCSSIIASLIVILTSALKSSWYSEYFGIPISNFDYFSSIRELSLCFGPCLLAILSVQLFVWLTFDDSTFYYPKNDIFFVLFRGAISIAITCCFVKIMIDCDKTHILEKLKISPIVVLVVFSCIMLIPVIGFTFRSYRFCYELSKNQNLTDEILVEEYNKFVAQEKNFRKAIKPIFWLIIIMAFAPYLILNVDHCCRPEHPQKVEFANREDESYAIIGNYNNSKIAMFYQLSDDGKNVIIEYGKYKFINPEDYEFECKEFDVVISTKLINNNGINESFSFYYPDADL